MEAYLPSSSDSYELQLSMTELEELLRDRPFLLDSGRKKEMLHHLIDLLYFEYPLSLFSSSSLSPSRPLPASSAAAVADVSTKANSIVSPSLGSPAPFAQRADGEAEEKRETKSEEERAFLSASLSEGQAKPDKDGERVSLSLPGTGSVRVLRISAGVKVTGVRKGERVMRERERSGDKR